jgi:hypothetical protein
LEHIISQTIISSDTHRSIAAVKFIATIRGKVKDWVDDPIDHPATVATDTIDGNIAGWDRILTVTDGDLIGCD